MILMNVTNPPNYNASRDRAFQFLDSHQRENILLIIARSKHYNRAEAPCWPMEYSVIWRIPRRNGPAGQLNHLQQPACRKCHRLQAATLTRLIYEVRTSHLRLSYWLDSASCHCPRLIRSYPTIAELCTRTTSFDYANISNIKVFCGLVYGVPQRQNLGSLIMFEYPGSN